VNFDNKTVYAIAQTLEMLNESLGDSFPIPPKMAQILSERRKALVRYKHLRNDSRSRHLGWDGIIDTKGTVTPVDMWMLWEELSEIHNLPSAFFSALGLVIRDDPGVMKVYNQGISYFFLTEDGRQTLNLKDAKSSLPAFSRVAWDGAMEGFWDVEDVMELPSCGYIPHDLIGDINIEYVEGPEIYLVKKDD